MKNKSTLCWFTILVVTFFFSVTGAHAIITISSFPYVEKFENESSFQGMLQINPSITRYEHAADGWSGNCFKEYILPYSLINFYGIINENAAKETQLTDEDIELLLDAIWNGTKSLISRSKAGQVPRALLKVNYKEDNYHIGDLNNPDMVSLISNLRDEEIRDITQVKLDITGLVKALGSNKEKISCIDYKADDRLSFVCNGVEKNLTDCLSDTGISLNQLTL